ncbi:hypothetical protein [Vulcanisaeta distributa]|uniref:Uncharacterized protein n=1 Tax=Vulcanisaeta distributa (strain DSM 14429 / JCM 11212 / NBRC 100878 / IC-017) TaxID=572478 RepID=E1QTG6_VULDI|nr:hypothetical protein [Vulcanisaeta distributa]ADN50959.1 hypothetical protein Vdis_1577 [Vulcanisaeta distributa DSM 14429]
MSNVIITPRRRNPVITFIIGLIVALVGLILYRLRGDPLYLVFEIPGVISMASAVAIYVSDRRKRAWLEESGALWGYKGAIVPSPKAPLTRLAVTNSLFGFVLLAIAWEMIVNPHAWLNLLVSFLVFASILVPIDAILVRGYVSVRRGIRTGIRDILLYGDYIRIRTGTNEIIDIPINDAVICIADFGWRDIMGNVLDTLRIRFAGTTYTLTVPAGIGREFINALGSIGINEVHTCNYLGIK